MALNERLYIVTYDIADPKRWRQVFEAMHAYGTWLQLSVFQCRLTARRRVALAMRLEREIKSGEDHVLILDIGPTNQVDMRIESLGKTVEAIRREATVI
jgi:CRISPR-associated protein Cas2